MTRAWRRNFIRLSRKAFLSKACWRITHADSCRCITISITRVFLNAVPILEYRDTILSTPNSQAWTHLWLTVENPELVLITLWCRGRFIGVREDFGICEVASAVEVLTHFLLVFAFLRRERSFFLVLRVFARFATGSEFIVAQFKLSRAPEKGKKWGNQRLQEIDFFPPW